MFLMMSVISVVPLSWLLKLEKVDQTKLKAIGRKKKSPWNKSWLFEKTKKIDKYLASLTMKKKVFELLESEIKWGGQVFQNCMVMSQSFSEPVSELWISCCFSAFCPPKGRQEG